MDVDGGHIPMTNDPVVFTAAHQPAATTAEPLPPNRLLAPNCCGCTDVHPSRANQTMT